MQLLSSTAIWTVVGTRCRHFTLVLTDAPLVLGGRTLLAVDQIIISGIARKTPTQEHPAFSLAFIAISSWILRGFFVLRLLRMLWTDETLRTEKVRAGGQAIVPGVVGGRTFDAGDQLLLDRLSGRLVEACQTEVQRTLELALLSVDDLVRVALSLQALQVVEFAW